MGQSLVLMSGPPGVGKSTLAKRICRDLKYILLDKDCIDECFSPGSRGESYTKNIEPKVLKSLLSLSQLNLELGHSIILDVPWTHILLNSPEWVDKIKDILLDRSDLKVIELTLDEETLYKRMKDRGLDRDQCKLSKEGWDHFKKTDRIFEKNPLPHLLLDANEDIELLLTKSLDYLSKA